MVSQVRAGATERNIILMLPAHRLVRCALESLVTPIFVDKPTTLRFAKGVLDAAFSSDKAPALRYLQRVLVLEAIYVLQKHCAKRLDPNAHCEIPR